MEFRRLLAISLVTLAVAGCSWVTVSADYDRSANFAVLRTYAWRPGTQPGTGDPQYYDRLIGTQVRGAIDRAFASKGYQQAASGAAPDFLVGYHAAVRQKADVQTINRWYGPGTGGWGGWPETYSHDYEEGTLLIDVIDPATMKLLWRGSGTGIVNQQVSAEKRERRISDAVDKILAKFPPH